MLEDEAESNKQGGYKMISEWLLRLANLHMVTRYFMKLFRGWVLKKIEEVVSITHKPPQIITVNGTSQGVTLKSQQVIFPLLVDSKFAIALPVKSIKCMFTYNGLAVQSLTWENGDDFASNGTKMVAKTIEPLKSSTIECRFNPFPYMPLLPESNERWGVKGAIEFQCFYGTFKREFVVDGLSIESPSDWTEIRSVYKQFYLSIFGEARHVVIS